MTARKTYLYLTMIAALAACGQEAPTTAVEKPAMASAPTGKLSAPVHIDYEVLGAAIVGQPVAIEIRLSSPLTDRPMSLDYFINDADSLMFPASQPQRIDLSIPGDAGVAARQVTVVPQREGRLYLNVTAEIETDNGVMLKSMAIPVSVGPASVDPEVNGELQPGANGASVISMPAREN